METIQIRLKRTNSKPEGFRVVDKPEYDVIYQGEVVGRIECRLTRTSNHYSAGFSKCWKAQLGTGIVRHGPYNDPWCPTKEAAKDSIRRMIARREAEAQA